MKRHFSVILFSIIIVIILGSFSGCSRAGLLSITTNRDDKAFQKMLDAVFAALDNGDKDGLRNLFAVSASEANPGLDSQIEAFLNVYSGPVEVENIQLLLYAGESTDHGKRRTELSDGGKDIVIVAGGVRYYIRMMMYSRDDFNNDNEGIHTLEFATEDAYKSRYFVYHNEGDDGPGFYYQDSAEKRSDIRWIEGRPWKYTPFDRKLTAENLRAVVEKNDDFKNFVAVVGEPNCSWTVYEYYYYELENGLFAVCKVDGLITHIRPDNDAGRVDRPGTIVALYIADEEKNLETVWTPDDITKVLGSYHYFLPNDRDLTEDSFNSFISRSQSISRLRDEIGLPDIDESRTYYYKISGDRYVQCRYRGDDIEDMSVVDSEERLYFIWKAGE